MGDYPSCALSNFAPNRFIIDGIQCESIEGFIQALKYKNTDKQREVCGLVGKDAKKAGKKKRGWRISKRVYWQGLSYGLFSDSLQQLIDRAYIACYEQCPEFRKAISALRDEDISHSIGVKDSRYTILSEYHFIRRINMLRYKSNVRRESIYGTE